jgi:hypothetical protein
VVRSTATRSTRDPWASLAGSRRTAGDVAALIGLQPHQFVQCSLGCSVRSVTLRATLAAAEGSDETRPKSSPGPAPARCGCWVVIWPSSLGGGAAVEDVSQVRWRRSALLRSTENAASSPSEKASAAPTPRSRWPNRIADGPRRMAPTLAPCPANVVRYAEIAAAGAGRGLLGNARRPGGHRVLACFGRVSLGVATDCRPRVSQQRGHEG